MPNQKRRKSKDIKRKPKKTTRKKRRSYLKTTAGLIALVGLGYLGKQAYDTYTSKPIQVSQVSQVSQKVIIPDEYKVNYNKTYIEVMPDVEGCWSKVLDFMSLSNIFTIDGKPPDATNFKPENFKDPNYNGLQMKWGTKFVCLGDTIDNGPNSIAILRLLKYLRENFCNTIGGCSVIFILGNRDINKLRLLYELDRNKARIDIETKRVDERLTPGKLEVPLNYPSQDRVTRFQWIMKNTMGGTGVLEHFKTETGITDNQLAIIEYMRILEPNGLLSYYLKNGTLLHYDSWTKSLFVHGGINCSNFKKWYTRIYEEGDNSENKYNSIFEWEKWTNEVLKIVLTTIYESQKDRSKRSRESTIDDEQQVEHFFRYMDEQIPKKAARSVIISRPWKSESESAKPEEMETGIGTSIIEEGCFDDMAKDVKYIFNGHTPVGQIPVIMRTAKGDKEIVFVFCDTTYAGRIGNIKLVKDGLGINDYQVAIKAKYTEEQKVIFDICGSKYSNFTELEYSTKDPVIGTGVGTSSYAIAQIGDNEYLTGKWKLEQGNLKYSFHGKISVTYDKTRVML
jgi:hypothetical protein